VKKRIGIYSAFSAGLLHRLGVATGRRRLLISAER
jgi:hypothetical protein